MTFYTICGKPECQQFAHATYVAQFLYEHLPNFKFRKIEKSKADWPNFVLKLNKKNSWYMVNSPIIWKEISAWGGKPFLIGGLGEFWDYCYCYYGLESSISKENLEKLAQDNLTFFEEETKNNLNKYQKYGTTISLFGSEDVCCTELLIEHLLRIPHFLDNNGFLIKLHKKATDCEKPENQKICLESIEEYFNSLAAFGNKPVVQIVSTEAEAVKNCDLLIFMEDFSRNEDEDCETWLNQCLNRMTALADTINTHAKRELRIIFNNDGSTCFMATCIIEYCPILLPTNIIAVTADRGLSVLSVISEMSKTPISTIGAPPVWGFIGINEYVDEANVICQAQVFKPFKSFRKCFRALTAPESSTIPMGTVVSELRLMSYLLPNQHDEIVKITQDRKGNIEAKLHRKPVLSKLRALKSLLELWYAEQPSDQIISLGVCSNGSYGLPPGLVFSQPCILDQKRRWKPFPNFPLMNSTTLLKLEELANESVSIVQKAGFNDNYLEPSDIDQIN